MDTVLNEGYVFKLFWTEAATGTVTTPPIVIAFDVIKYCCPHHIPVDKAFTVDAFHFQRVEEALRTGIIVTATFGAHAPTQIMPFQQHLISH